MADEINFSDLSSLQSRINEIKKEGEECVDFTLRYIECLMYRHSLKESLPDDVELDFLPEHLMDKFKNGIIPEREELVMLSPEEQNQLVFELIWFCGMLALVSYGADDDIVSYEAEDGEIHEMTSFEVILDMRNQSMGHYSATYIISALSLLMAQIPSQNLVGVMTNDYEDSEEQVQKNVNIFIELASAILDRYEEDMAYFYVNHPEEKLSQETSPVV